MLQNLSKDQLHRTGYFIPLLYKPERQIRSMGTRAGTLDDVLYAPLEVNKTGMLKVSSLHTVYWEESGNSAGLPVMVLHGGPGGGSQADYRRYFDPASYRIVQMDQRGCGK